MGYELTALTKQCVQLTFSVAIQDSVMQFLVEHCGEELPLMTNDDTARLERIRIAVLKLSEGELARLESAVRGAHTDWRDTLMAADFGDSIEAHIQWVQEGCRSDG